MTKEPKNIPLMIALEYMQKVNNLLNHLIREDNFPAILFAKYDDTFHELLRIAQVVNYKYAGTCNPDMDRMSSKGREAALSQLMKEMIDKGDLDEEMAN